MATPANILQAVYKYRYEFMRTDVTLAPTSLALTRHVRLKSPHGFVFISTSSPYNENMCKFNP